ncbi:hypothetical protein DFQ26_002074 [Actinomortierella ambigua]|nr:hypothetical protein DFQ26_002074 [Actinomortierella ambigua]
MIRAAVLLALLACTGGVEAGKAWGTHVGPGQCGFLVSTDYTIVHGGGSGHCWAEWVGTDDTGDKCLKIQQGFITKDDPSCADISYRECHSSLTAKDDQFCQSRLKMEVSAGSDVWDDLVDCMTNILSPEDKITGSGCEDGPAGYYDRFS